MALVSLREFARQHGWNPGYAHKLKSRGVLVMRDEGGKELVDVEASNAAIEAAKDPAKGYMAEVNSAQRQRHGKPESMDIDRADPVGNSGTESRQSGTSSNATYHQAKAASELYRAKLSQLEYEQRIGKMVRTDDVRTALASRITQVRDSILQVPARLAPVIAAESSPARVRDLMEEELRRTLEQIAAPLNFGESE